MIFIENIVKEITLPKGKDKQKYNIIIHNPNSEEEFNKYYSQWLSDMIHTIIDKS